MKNILPTLELRNINYFKNLIFVKFLVFNIFLKFLKLLHCRSKKVVIGKFS